MKRKSILLALACSLAALAFADRRGDYELVRAGSWVYDALTAITLETGTTNFTDQAPLTVREIRMYLAEVDYDFLSPAGKVQYNRIIAYFAEENFSLGAGIFSLGLEPEIAVEGYYKTNDDIDWTYDRYQRKALVFAPLKFQANDYFTMEMDLSFGLNKGQMGHDDTYTNIPFSQDAIDINFPDTGYLSTGFHFTDTAGFAFQLGMGPQSVGRSLTGSIIMSEYFTGASYANMELYSPNLRYNMNVTQFNVDKYMYTHRIDLRLFKKFQISAMESILVNAPLELRFLNPFTIYHGMSPWRDYEPEEDDPESHTCAYLAIKASYTPTNYFRIYGLYAQDQFQTKYEMDNWPDNVTPNGLGGQLGVEAFIPAGEGYIHGWLEGSYADPYLYIKEDPNWSMVRTYSENIGDKAIFYEWVGSPFGPDTISAELNLGYEIPGKWALTGTYLFMARGEYAGTNVFTDALDWGGQDRVADVKNWVYPNVDYHGEDEAKRRQSLKTPSGTPEYVNRLSVRGVFTPQPYMTFALQPAYVFIYNYNNTKGSFRQGFEFALSTQIKLSRMFGR